MSDSLASGILEGLGGASNIGELENCMTRLRVVVHDVAKVDRAALTGTKGVLGLMGEGKELQVVVGPGVSDKVCSEIRELGVKVVEGQAAGALPVSGSGGAKGILEFFAHVFAPLIPVFAGSGLLFGIKQVFVLIYNLTGMPLFNPADIAEGGSVFMAALVVLCGTFFTYLNIAVAMSASKTLGGNPYLGLVAGGIVSNVGGLAGVEMGFLGLTFASGRGGTLSALAAGALCAVIERQVRKRTPNSLAVHLPSLITIVIVGLITLFVLQPVLGLVMDGITTALVWLFENAGPLGGAAISFAWLPLVMLGVHHGFTPIQTALIQELGYTPLYPFGSLAGGGQVGASLALLVKYRSNKSLCDAVKGGLPAGILGIGEPLIYGVSLPLGRVFPLACAGGAVGGFFLGFFTQGSITINVSGILGALVNINVAAYLGGYGIAVLFGFLFVYFVGATPESLEGFEEAAADSQN